MVLLNRDETYNALSFNWQTGKQVLERIVETRKNSKRCRWVGRAELYSKLKDLETEGYIELRTAPLLGKDELGMNVYRRLTAKHDDETEGDARKTGVIGLIPRLV